MSKRYFQVRRKRRNELIMKALQFESASWTWEGINDIMLKATKSMRAKVVRTQQPTTVEAPQVEDDDEEQEEGEEEELLHWELGMN